MIERRNYVLGNCVLRSKGEGKHLFRGHAAVFNSLSDDLGGFRERVAPGAFGRALEERQDTVFLIDHDPSKLLGRVAAGTLKLNEDDRGLAVESELPDTTYARDLAVLMERGDIHSMSFGFRVKKDTWEERDGEQIRTLHDVDLVDVSAVVFPAYPQTDADVEARQLLSALQEVRAGKVLSQKNRDALLAVIESLSALVSQADDDVEENALNPRKLRLSLREKSLGL